MGTYAVVFDTDRKEKRKALENREKDIHNIHGERFRPPAPTLFENAANSLEENSLPYIGVRYDGTLPQDPENYLFASNLTCTIGMSTSITPSRIQLILLTENFHNEAHYDNDASDVTYGIWAPCDKHKHLSFTKALPSRTGLSLLHLTKSELILLQLTGWWNRPEGVPPKHIVVLFLRALKRGGPAAKPINIWSTASLKP